MYLDCLKCPGRGHACQGCVVSVLLDPRPLLDPDVARAMDVLQDAGMIGPGHLALVPEYEAGHRLVSSPVRRAG